MLPNYDCYKCKETKNYDKKATIRNCSFINTDKWINNYGNSVLDERSSECIGGILMRNLRTIEYIQVISRKGQHTLDLSFIENKAILDYMSARDRAIEYVRKQNEKKNK